MNLIMLKKGSPTSKKYAKKKKLKIKSRGLSMPAKNMENYEKAVTSDKELTIEKRSLSAS